ncbi:MAG: hypothetical protein ACLQVI_23185 [Polyangiaceae bacterium]|jgi:hypothetical protein
MSAAKCPTCSRDSPTWYECLKCHKTMCNDCYQRNHLKCPSCGHSGKKTIHKPTG